MSARVLFLELAARGVNMRSGQVPCGLSTADAGVLMRRVRTNRDGLREVLKDRHDPDVLAIKQEGGVI